MAGSKFKCKICGKEYSCCEIGLKKYPYKQIVCSNECWQQWLTKINKNKKTAKSKVVEKPIVKVAETNADIKEDIQPVVTEATPAVDTIKKL